MQIGNPGVELDLYPARCPVWPIEVHEETLTFIGGPGFDDITMMRADLMTGEIDSVASLPGPPRGATVVHDDRAYVMLPLLRADAEIGVVAALDLRSPWPYIDIASAPVTAHDLGNGRFAVGDGWVAWLDGDTPIDESPAEPWRVIVRGASGDVATELPSAAYSLTAAGGALWMLEKPEERFVPRTHVLRVPDGSAPASGTTTFAFGPDVGPDGASAIYGFGDDLLVRTPDGRLLLQPLP